MTVLYNLFFNLPVTFDYILLQLTPSNSYTLCHRHLLHILRLLILFSLSTWMSWCMVLVFLLIKQTSSLYIWIYAEN